MNTAINHVNLQKIIAFMERKCPGIMEQVSLLKITQDQEDDACLIFDFRYKEKQRGGLDKMFQLFVTHAHGLYNAIYRLTERGTGDLLPVHAWLSMRQSGMHSG